ncbi:hypothetical protein J421_0422 [Gemmatirosa kalamazoonensis]|uniref:ATP-grasp domain-containing protein n=1 Tax=Gemmatirosa kalamazoonensis TaxID=861299 RepID=W0RA18_9BACT|nr:glutathione synthase [Gemmatirosa kalamazoonensis]AHG87959.1 hypothetical protein J421_0422 [Gemmatirosa kalamazoonensis]
MTDKSDEPPRPAAKTGGLRPKKGLPAAAPTEATAKPKATTSKATRAPSKASPSDVSSSARAIARTGTGDAAAAGAVDANLAAAGAPAVVERTRTGRIGLFVGREWSWPPAFIEAVNARDAGVVAEFAKIGAPHFDEPCPYDVCIDRISHEVPMYRSYLKQAALQGSTVVNNPFMWSADDKFFGAALAHRLGVASPKTVVLPNRSYVPGIVPTESLRNLEYPLDWQGIVDYVGLPCVLKDAHGGGWKDVYICRTVEELIENYNETGLLTMVVQEFIEWEHFVRCLVIGRHEVLPMKYDPKARKYIVEHAHLSPELGARIVGDARKLCNALGYDMNSMEFAIRGGVPYAIDFMNPAPDMDINSLTPEYFKWAVEKMADLAVRLVQHPRQLPREVGWASLFAMGR